MPVDAYLVITNLPDRDSAVKLAQALIEKHVAACVNILSPCRSVYRWKGKTEDAEEFPMLIKTTRARYTELEAAIRAGHPYELPEIIAVPLSGGLPAYLEWVDAETRLPQIACDDC
ncbi:MAG TPA: divalent-cation tolerance protein CutA [Burkholderiales bacterium]|nr:divalent-cation tolerance protein CutA [Burkholderiales bacterium]